MDYRIVYIYEGERKQSQWNENKRKELRVKTGERRGKQVKNETFFIQQERELKHFEVVVCTYYKSNDHKTKVEGGDKKRGRKGGEGVKEEE